MESRPGLVALFALSLAAPLGAQALDFARMDYGAGDDPGAVAMADFDQDGQPDLAVADRAANQVVILYGQGAGTFGSTVSAGTVGSQPSGLVGLDLDGDGLADLATSNFGSMDVSVLHNGPAGTFTRLAAAPLGAKPTWLAAADFDGDGDIDLVAPEYAPAQEVSLLLGNGDATFAPAVPLPLPSGMWAQHLDPGDVDSDGDADLAVAVQSSWQVACLMNGGGALTWTAVATNLFDGWSERVSLGTIDGDSFPDLVVTANDLGDRTVVALRGNGAGGFGPAKLGTLAFGASSFAHAFHHVDGDAALDVLVGPAGGGTIYGPPTVQIFRGTGAGLALATAMQVPSAVRDFAVADLDVDGRADYAVTAALTDEVAVFLQRVPLVPSITSTSPSTILSLAAAPQSLVVLGSGFTTLKFVALDGTPKFGAVVHSDTRVTLNLPNPAATSSALGVTAVTFVGSGSTSVPVVPPGQPLLLGPATFSKFSPPSMLLSGAGAGDLVFLGGSFDLLPSSLPGVVDLEIGNGFSTLVYLGAKVMPPVGWDTIALSAAGLPVGQALHFQTAVLPLGGGLPLLASNVLSGSVGF